MGYVYVLSNDSMPGVLKIGCTDRTPGERLVELSAATGVPTPFTLEFATYFRNHAEVEARIHRDFSGSRVNDSREFFRVARNTVVEYLEEVLLEDFLTQVESLRDPVRERLLAKLEHKFMRWKR